MNKATRKILLHWSLSTLAIIGIWHLVWPYFQYYLDTDAVAYMTIAQRYAAQDFPHAINGMWSPLQLWIISPFMGSDLKSNFEIAQLSNLIVILFIQLMTLLWLRLSSLNYVSCISILWTMVPCLVCFSYLQVFGDLLSVFLLMLSFYLLMFQKNRPIYLALAALLGALAYYAKSYNFYYFPLVLILILFTDRTKPNWLKWKESLYALFIFGFALAPWINLLHQKYGKWTSGISGELNMTWYLVNHREYRADLDLLVPPIYKDSPSFWEDPWWVQGPIHHATESIDMLLRKLARIGHTFFDTIEQISYISPLAILGIFYMLLLLASKTPLSRPQRVLIIATAILPLGYLTVHVESRYLWLLLPIALIFSYHILQKIYDTTKFKAVGYGSALLIATTFWAHPMIEMEKLLDKGKTEYMEAQVIIDAGLKGQNFISNRNGGELWKIMYWSQNQFYETQQKKYTASQLASEINKYEIDAILYFTQEASDWEIDLEVYKSLGFSQKSKTDGMLIFTR